MDPKTTLAEYLGRVSEHDVAGALSYVGDGFRLVFVDGPTLTKEDLARALGWDAGTRGEVEWNVVSASEDEIVIEGSETNEFLRLLGMKPLAFRSVYRFDERGLIAGQEHEVDWSRADIEAAMTPAIEWARAHAPEELGRAYPDERMVYSAETGRCWVELLERWREATGAS